MSSWGPERFFPFRLCLCQDGSHEYPFLDGELRVVEDRILVTQNDDFIEAQKAGRPAGASAHREREGGVLFELHLSPSAVVERRDASVLSISQEVNPAHGIMSGSAVIAELVHPSDVVLLTKRVEIAKLMGVELRRSRELQTLAKLYTIDLADAHGADRSAVKDLFLARQRRSSSASSSSSSSSEVKITRDDIIDHQRHHSHSLGKHQHHLQEATRLPKFAPIATYGGSEPFTTPSGLGSTWPPQRSPADFRSAVDDRLIREGSLSGVMTAVDHLTDASDAKWNPMLYTFGEPQRSAASTAADDPRKSSTRFPAPGDYRWRDHLTDHRNQHLSSAYDGGEHPSVPAAKSVSFAGVSPPTRYDGRDATGERLHETMSNARRVLGALEAERRSRLAHQAAAATTPIAWGEPPNTSSTASSSLATAPSALKKLAAAQRGDSPSRRYSPEQIAAGNAFTGSKVLCPWCRKFYPPTHPQECPDRVVQCRRCREKVKVKDRGLHRQSCPGR